MESVVFTNGCFDLIHPGHIELLTKARSLGNRLVVGLNSDESVRRIKGYPRPFMNQDARRAVLEGLRAVDEVCIFEENTPAQLIEQIKPDILVKGGDWAQDRIIGAGFVLENGGKVFSIPFESDFSSSKIVEKIKASDRIEDSDFEKNKNNLPENLFRKKIEFLENLCQMKAANISECAGLIVKTISTGNEIFFYGSESVSFITNSLAAKFNRHFEMSGKGASACVLGESPRAILSEKIKKGNLLITFSVDGNEDSLLSTVSRARARGCATIGVTGRQGKKLAALCDRSVLILSDNAYQLQESCLIIGHLWRDYAGGHEINENIR